MPIICLLCCPIPLIAVGIMAYCKRRLLTVNSPVLQSQTSVGNLPGRSAWMTDYRSSRAGAKGRGPQADPVSMVLSKMT